MVEQDLQNLISIALEKAPSIVMITDSEGNIIYVNDMFVSTTGYSKEEIIGKNPRILKSGRNPSCCYEKLWENLLNEKEWKGDFINRTKTGEYVWEVARIMPIRLGKKLYYIKLADVFSKSSRIIRTFFEFLNHSSYIVLVLDKEYTIKFCNYTLSRILIGDSDKNLLGLSWFNFLSENNIHVIKMIYKQIFEEAKENTYAYKELTYEIQDANNKVLVVKWFITLLNSETNFIFHIGIPCHEDEQFTQDIDHMRKYYKQMIERDRTFIEMMKAAF